MSSHITLITGGNRGIGKGLVQSLLTRDNQTIIATARDPTDKNAQSLEELPKGKNTTLLLVKIDASFETDAAAAAKLLQSQHNISHIDTIIASAGIAKTYASVAETSISDFKEHFEVNALGPVILFQAFWPLLQKSKNPKFVAITTGLATLTDMADWPMPVAAYGGSKAVLNFYIRKAHFENPELTTFVLSPGWVQTDMGNAGATASGMEKAPTTLQESVDGILNRVDNATREKTGGTFASFDETKFNW